MKEAQDVKMTLAPFNEKQFERRLLNLKSTHESISTLSNWCLQNPSYSSQIISIWLNVLKQVKIEHRLLLFYFANDVIQYSKKRKLPFVDGWAPALQKATTMVRDDTVKNKVLRLFKIWDERSIYDESFLMDLSGLLTHNKFNRTDLNEFQTSVMFSRMRSCKKTTATTSSLYADVKKTSVHAMTQSQLKELLKKATKDDAVLEDIDQGIHLMKEYIQSVEIEVKERAGLIELMELGELYYEKEATDSRTVYNAYKCFGSKITHVLSKLKYLIPTLPSPPNSPAQSPLSPEDSNPELPDLLRNTIEDEPYTQPPVYTPQMTLSGDFSMNSVKSEKESSTEYSATSTFLGTDFTEFSGEYEYPDWTPTTLQPPPPPPVALQESLPGPESPPQDVDLRTVDLAHVPSSAVDNLPVIDTDYRSNANIVIKASSNLITIDNNESIDMDLSDDDEKHQEARKQDKNLRPFPPTYPGPLTAPPPLPQVFKDSLFPMDFRPPMLPYFSGPVPPPPPPPPRRLPPPPQPSPQPQPTPPPPMPPPPQPRQWSSQRFQHPRPYNPNWTPNFQPRQRFMRPRFHR